MTDILLTPQQLRFFSKRPGQKNFYNSIMVFKTDPSFDVELFDVAVNKVLRDSGIGNLSMSENPVISDVFTPYKTTVTNDNSYLEINFRAAVEHTFLESSKKVDVSSGTFIVGTYTGKHMLLLFNHLIFDLEGIVCLFEQIVNSMNGRPVTCTCNTNELVKVIGTQIESSYTELERPWTDKGLPNFILEKKSSECATEMDMRLTGLHKLIDEEKLKGIEMNLTSPTNGKNKGVQYLILGSLLATYYEMTNNAKLLGRTNHTYTGMPLFKQFSNIITWKVCGVPFILEFCKESFDKKDGSYFKKIKEGMDVYLDEGYKIDLIVMRYDKPRYIDQLLAPIFLFNFRLGFAKLEENAKKCGLNFVRDGYYFVPRLSPTPARHLFYVNIEKFTDGLYLDIEYSSKNFTIEFVNEFIRRFKVNFDLLLEQCRKPVFN